MARQEEFNRNEIISKAIDVFWAKGYNGTSIQDLVDATGLNRSSIYNSFGSKRKLYRAALELYEGEANKTFQRHLLRSTGPLEAIKRILEGALITPAEGNNRNGCFILNCKTELSTNDSELKHWLFKNQENSIHLFKDLIIEGQGKGEINNLKSAEDYAYYLFNAFQGLRLTGILTKDQKIMRNIIDSTIQNLK